MKKMSTIFNSGGTDAPTLRDGTQRVSKGIIPSLLSNLRVGLLICGFLCAATIIANAQSGTTGSLSWSISGDTLTISGKGSMPNYYMSAGVIYSPWRGFYDSFSKVIIESGVTTIGEYAFYGCKALKSVTIPNTVTSIGFVAFSGTGLTSVTIPESVTSLGGAFFGCTELSTVYFNANCTFPGGGNGGIFSNCTAPATLIIGNNVTWIPDNAFQQFTGLTSVTIPNNVEFIGESAFANCTSLTSIAIPNKVIQIPSSVFSGCTSLVSVTIPNSVEFIGESVFFNCTSLTSITIPNRVIQIFPSAFSGCTSLLSVTIPENVQLIGNQAFSNCTNLTTVNFNAIYCSTYMPGGIGTPQIFPNCPALTTLNIGNNVEIIPAGAFSNCMSLISVTFPNNLQSIGESAFSSCTGLTSVTIPNSILRVENNAFASCTGLTYANIDNSGYISHFMFSKCTGLKSITIGNSVTHIGFGAFSDCTGLTSVTIPDNVLLITNRAFLGCTSLMTATIGNGVTSIGEWAFYNCTSMNSLTIGEGVQSIGNHAFYNCTNLTTVNFNAIDCTTIGYINSLAGTIFSFCTTPATLIIGNSVTRIPDHAFRNWTGLSSVTIGNSVTSIGDYVFRDCNNISTVNFNATNCVQMGTNSLVFSSCSAPATLIIGSNVVRIPDRAFSSFTGLISANIGNSVTSIGVAAFSGCNGLNSINIPENVQSIGANAFSNCIWLNSINIPENVQSIGAYAFGNCSNLTTVNFNPSNCTIMGSSSEPVFPYCTAEATLIIGDNVTSIPDHAFRQWPGLSSVTIGNSVTSIGDAVFYTCNGLNSITIPENVQSIGNSAFSSCSNLTTVNFNPSNCTTMGSSSNPVFQYCTAAATLNIGDNVTKIPDHAFRQWSGLSSVSIGNSIKSIGATAFSNCTGLMSVTIPENVQSIGTNAFSSCSNLTRVNFNSSNCTTMGSSSDPVFQNCTALATLKIGDNVTSIPDHAFRQWIGLSSFTIGNSVALIGEYSFYGCTSMTEIVNHATTPHTINSNVFTNVNKNTCILHVPAASVTAYQTKDVWNEFSNIVAIIKEIEINATNFPDANFRQYLLEQPYGSDGKLSDEEITNITFIDVNNKYISDLTGIHFFTSLFNLLCYGNPLTSIDLTSNTDLTYLDCTQNQLKSLDVSMNIRLQGLYFASNLLTSIDVSKNTALINLTCSNNQLTLLDISKNTRLQGLYFDSNLLTSIDVSKNTALISLTCSNNQLTLLDVSKNTALTTLNCYNNQLISLDVSKNTALTTLNCYNNQLTSLNLSYSTTLLSLYCYSNQLSSLDLSHNTSLSTLQCSNNQLISLDVSKNTALTTLYCPSNQLTLLDVSKNTALTTLSCFYNQLTSINLTGLNSLTTFSGSNQTPVLHLTGSNNNYSYIIDMNTPTFDQSGLSYNNGKLTSTSNAITTSSFTVQTGLANYTLSGSLTLSYPTNKIDLSLNNPTSEGIGWTYANDIYTIQDDADVIVTGNNAGSERRITVADDAKDVIITLEDVTISGLNLGQSALSLGNGAEVTLMLAGTNILTGGNDCASIQTTGATLTIYGTGSLTANGGDSSAGIGGSNGSSGGTITINGGTVTVMGGGNGAGIGGGNNGAGGDITINGGTVTVYGSGWGAGIGGGIYSAGGDITITGGTVSVLASSLGVGIGGGGNGGESDKVGGAGGNVSISGGIVTVFGYCGIGGGAYSVDDGTLTMDGDAVVFVSWGIEANIDGVVRGILFDGYNGTFYGESVTITDDVEIPNGYTLKIPLHAALTIPAGKTLTNNGTVYLCGTINRGNTYGVWTGNEPEECIDPTYGVSIGTFANGSVSADKTAAMQGETVTLTIMPVTGYELESIFAIKTGDATMDVTLDGSGYERTFIMPDYAVTVTATFKKTQDTNDKEAVQTAKEAIEDNLFSVAQLDANTDDAVKTRLVTWINSLINETGITVTKNDITINNFVPAANGTNGSFNFDVALEKGNAPGTASGSGTVLAEPIYAITVETATNGNLSSDLQTAMQGETVTLAITPDAGYELDVVNAKKTGETTSVVQLSGSGDIRTFSMPAYDVTVRAFFKKTQETLDLEAVSAAKDAIENTSFTVSQLTANSEASVKFWLSTQINSLIASTGIRVTGENITLSNFIPADGETNGSFEFTVSIAKGDTDDTASNNGTISTESVYTVLIGILNNGSVSTDKHTAQEDETVTLTVTPAAGYELDIIVANKTGDPITIVALDGLDNIRTYTMPAYDVIVTATFKKTQATLDAEAVAIAKDAIENNTYIVAQLTANTETTVKTWLVSQINSLIAITGITVTENNLTLSSFTSSAGNTNGSFNFDVALTKGDANGTASKNGTISSDPVYAVLIGIITNGNVSTDKTTAQQGETVMLTITPKTGYKPDIVAVYKTGEPATVLLLSGTGNTRTFAMPAYDVTVTVTFEKTQETIDDEAVASARNDIEGGTYHIAQQTANDDASVKTWLLYTLDLLFGQSHGLQLRSSSTPIDALVEVTSLTPAIAGTETNPEGINGAFTFTVTLKRGATEILTAPTNGVILATPYVVTQQKLIELLPVDELTVRIINTGNVATGELTLTLSGANAGFFTLPLSTINSLMTGDDAEVVIAPIENLQEGVYKVTLTVSGDGISPVSIELTYAAPPTSNDNPQSTLMRAWVQNGLLHVTGLTVGESLYIYNLYGMLVYKSIVTSEEAIIPLRTQGVYIVLSGKNTVKVVYN